MPESRRVNTGGGAHAERATVTRNANRRHYGDAAEGDTAPAHAAGRRTPVGAHRERVRPVTPVGTQVFTAARAHLDAMDAGGTGPLREAVDRIEAEAMRGHAADPAVVVRALRTLADLVPELGAAVSAGLTDPSAGMAEAVRWAAAQAVDPRRG